MAYLAEHPPARRQFYDPRRGGGEPLVVVIHTAENRPDTIGADGGAEAVARFISRRSDPGSYHRIVDSDSVVMLGEDSWEMFGSGQPSQGNRWMLHLSFATQASEWGRLSSGYVSGMWTQAASIVAEWCDRYAIPVRAVTRTDVELGIAAGTPVGICRHADLDPARRTDPGWDDRTFAMFLDDVAAITGDTMTPEQEAMLVAVAADVDEIKRRLSASELDPPGPRWWIEQRVLAIDEAVQALGGGQAIDIDALAGQIADELAERLRS